MTLSTKAETIMSMQPAFWDQFAKDYWDVKPGSFSDDSGIQLTTDDLFAGYLRAFERIANVAREGGSSRQICDFYVNGRVALSPEIAKFDPRNSTSLEGYIETVSERLGGERFGVHIHEFHRYIPQVWEPMLAFVAPLVDRVGLPASRLESALFFGDYPTTPFGIHRDVGNSVFTFPVLGKKRFLLWPPDHFAADPLCIYREPDPRKYEKDALVLEARPGTFLYWPRDWMHIAFDTACAPHAAFSIGTWSQSSVSDQLSSLVAGSVDRAAGEAATPPAYARGDLPADIASAIDRLEEMVRSGALRELAGSEWRRKVANFGFRPPEAVATSTGDKQPH